MKVIREAHCATIGTCFFAMHIIKDLLEDQSDPDQLCISHLKRLLVAQLRKGVEHDPEQFEMINVCILL
jgi:hypothetical protein